MSVGMKDEIPYCHIIQTYNTPFTMFTRSKIYLYRDLDSNLDCDLDRYPEDVPVYTGHSFFSTTKCITLFFIVRSFFHRNPPNIGIKIIQSVIQIECLHGTKFLDPDRYLDRDLDNFAPCKRGIRPPFNSAFRKCQAHQLSVF